MQATKYIVVKNALGETRAYLSPDDGVKDCFIDRRVNGEGKLEFLLPLQSEKWAELTPECRIIADGREFTILRPSAIDAERSQDGKAWGKVMAEESWALMDKQDVTVSNDPQTPEPADLQVAILSGGASAGGFPQGSAGSALTYLLQEQTEWVLGTVDVDGARDLETEKLSLLQNVKKVQELWGGLLVWEYVLDEAGNVTQRKIHLRDEAKWQNYTGFQVRYGKNLKHITRTANHDIVTRLYPFGQDDLDISSVNGGVKYLENFSYTQNVYVGFFVDQEIYDPQTLKVKAAEALAKMCKPRYAYRVGLVDTTTLPEWSHEKYSLGDMADVVAPDVGTGRMRIQRHRYNVFQPWICELEVGEPEETLQAQLASSFNAAEFINKRIKPNPTIANMMKSYIDTFVTTINGASGDYTCVDGVSTWWNRDEQGDRTGEIVRITPKGLGISDDGGQTFDLAIVGKGILADKIVVTDEIALCSWDGYTKMIGSGLAVFDDALQKRVHIGKYAANRWGIQIDTGSLEIIGTLPDSNIPDIWASKIKGGTITATDSIFLGGAEFELNAMQKHLMVSDSLESPRVIVGKNGLDYGLWVYNSLGDILFDAERLNIGQNGVAVKTADTGARVELDYQGIRAYNADEVNTVNIDITGEGNNLMTGTFMTAPVGETRVQLSHKYGDIDIYYKNPTLGEEHIFRVYNGIDHVSLYSPTNKPIHLGNSANSDLIFHGKCNFADATGKADTLLILLRDVAFYANGAVASYADDSTVKWTWTKDTEGRITVLHNVADNFDINVNWNAGDVP
jgi:hypothetical protein